MLDKRKMYIVLLRSSRQPFVVLGTMIRNQLFRILESHKFWDVEHRLAGRCHFHCLRSIHIVANNVVKESQHQ